MENKKIIQVSIFNPGTSKNEVLTTNGDAILDNIVISWETFEDLFSGDYTLDLTAIIDGDGLHKLLKVEAILKVHMDYGDEIFEISKVNRGTRDIKVFARQITIQKTLNMWLVDVRPTNTNGQNALNILKNNSTGTKDIEFFSDIDTISTAYYMDMSLYEALHNCDQSFMNRWGGEILRRGYTVAINKRIGADRGVQIRSGKNLTGFVAKIDIDRVVTRIVAKGFDGIRGKKFIDSPLIHSYSSIKTKEIKYDFVKVKNENNPGEGFNTLKEAQAELERLAKLEFSKNHIDELRAEYDLNYIQLEKIEEYKNFVQAERAFLGDTINVFEEKHNINIHVRCFQKKFDGKRQKVISMKLTNTDINQKSITTSDILAELNSIIKKTDNNNVQDIIQSMINSGIKDSYVIPRQNEIIIADNKDLNLAVNVCRLNKNGLAFSKTGYYGEYTYGFTIDGVINASLIATGVLSTILIQNADGSLQIDLSGKNGIITKKNGKNAIELAGAIMKFYDWNGGDAIGQLYSTRFNGDEDAPGITLANKSNCFLSLGYEKNGTFYSYIRCNKDNIDSATKVPITIFEETEFRGKQMWFGHNLNSIYKANGNHLVLSVKNDFIVGDRDSGYDRMRVSKDRVQFNGDLVVVGNKNCVQKTKKYGDRLFYSVEDCESYLTDRSMHLLDVEKVITNGIETYERVILLDNIFKDSVNLDLDYTVEIIKQGFGDYRIKEQTKDYFIVESDRADFTFKYVVTAKRKEFEDERNKEIFLNSNGEILNQSNENEIDINNSKK